MPVYNGMPFLIKSVASILRQTHRNFELIIVDDASTDDSANYIKGLKDKRVRLITNKKNLGLAESLNIAIKSAKGEFIARMDADDVSLPNRLKEQVFFLNKHPKIDLCGTWVDLIDENGKKVGEKKYPTKASDVRKSITWYTAVIHPTFMGKKSFFKKMNGYRANYDFAEDYDLLQRAKNDFTIVNIPKKLLLWRHQKNRRSRENMQKMDKVELKIKIESLKRDGFSIIGMLALLRKIFFTYFLPPQIKFQIAIILKLA